MHDEYVNNSENVFQALSEEVNRMCWDVRLEEADERGYNNGFMRGQNDGFKQGQEDGFKLGQKNGFKQGQEDGFKLGQKNGFKQGQDAGFKQGQDAGFKRGEEKGRLLAIKIVLQYYNGSLTLKECADQLGISEKEFKEYLNIDK